MEGCFCKKDGITTCEMVGIILGIIVGIATGVLFSLGLIPVVINLIRIALVFSVVGLAVLLGILYVANIIKGYNGFYKSVCKFSKIFLTGIIGTFLATTITAIIGVVGIVTIPAIIFVTLSAFFFVLMTISLICILTCIIEETCRNKCN